MTNSPQGSPIESPPRAVIDTNVVLDWLWFDDPATRRLGAAIVDRQVDWIACPAMRVEIEDVLGRPQFVESRKGSRESVLASFDSLSRMMETPARAHPLVCSDPDDQVFLDLALAHGVRWLLSRDRALLHLAPRAAAWRCTITTPGDWELTGRRSP